ncbi:MAG: restriction endonuclease subunit S [Proteobacteria bacterium]|nr:restriction endonuclease subunit S [Pseudomonadota bacterium]
MPSAERPRPGYRMTEVGTIPVDWEVSTLKKISEKFISGGTPDTEVDEYWDGDIEWTTGVGVTSYLIKSGQRRITKKGLKNSASNLVPKGNILIVSRTGVGKVAMAEIDIAISQDLTGLIVNKTKANNDFVLWQLLYRTGQLKRFEQGTTIKGILRKDISDFLLPLSPLPEQEKIAAILTKVDEDIQKTDEIIAAAQQLKKGLMQTLLTKGIGHTKFKKTEVGRIPEEWEAKHVKDIAKVKGGKRLPKGEKFADTKTEYPYIRVVDFQEGTVDVSELRYLRPEIHEVIKRYTILSEDVYISIAGTIGLAGIVPEELSGANLTENAAKLCKIQGVDKRYLAYYLNSERGQHFIRIQTGMTSQPKLALNRLEKIPVPLPGMTEQEKIAEILAKSDDKIRKEREKKEQLLRLKRGLMQVLLTGKVRVNVDKSKKEAVA